MPAITASILIPITPPPLEAVPCPRQAFGGFINDIAAKDHTLQRPVPKEDGAKFGSNSSNRLFQDNNSPALFAADSAESPTLFSNPNLVSNFPVSSSPFGKMHTNTPMMDIVSEFTPNDPSASLSALSGSFIHPHHVNSADSDAAMKKLFEECLVNDFEDDDSPYLFTPYTNDTSFTHSTLTSGLDTPSIDLAQIDSYLNSSLGNQDFNLFGDSNAVSADDWTQNPLFNPASLAEDPIAPYALFNKNTATVTSASPQQFSFSSIGDDQSTAVTLPTPELSPSTSRKAPRRAPAPRRTSSATPFTPITPAPTTPSTPQNIISRATKRRLPVIDEDPAIIEKRRRNTVAAQRSRQRKAEEKQEDKVRINQLEKELENVRVLVSYWKDRACELGASPLEDGET
jgi:hypothetical protein